MGHRPGSKRVCGGMMADRSKVKLVRAQQAQLADRPELGRNGIRRKATLSVHRVCC